MRQFTPPPRPVPLTLTLVNFFNGAAQIGWAIFGFGMIFFWAFAGNADFSALTFRGAIAQTTGKVTRVAETGASENHRAIQANHYEFSVAGERFSGKSYSSGGGPAVGDEVTVEYKEGNPRRSRIAGERMAQFGPRAAIVTIFPLIGFLILYFSTRSGIKRNYLLREGLLTTGKLVAIEPTNMTVNKRRVMELTFEFTDRSGRKCEAKAHSTDTSRLEDEPEEPLLYDPNDPTKAYLLDEAPARPKLGPDGQLEGRPVAAALALILPGLVIAGHALVLLIKWKLRSLE